MTGTEMSGIAWLVAKTGVAFGTGLGVIAGFAMGAGILVGGAYATYKAWQAGAKGISWLKDRYGPGQEQADVSIRDGIAPAATRDTGNHDIVNMLLEEGQAAKGSSQPSHEEILDLLGKASNNTGDDNNEFVQDAPRPV